MADNSTNTPTAHYAAEQVADALRAARTEADTVAPDQRVAALVQVADGWLRLAVAMSQYQTMTPPPSDDR